MTGFVRSLQQVLNRQNPGLPADTKRILLKESLQALVLDYLYNHPQYRKLRFYGGTCLHVLYGLNRLSEDLDLDNSAGVNLEILGQDLKVYFSSVLLAPAVDLTSQQGGGGILRLTLKFPVLYELGLSSLQNEALHLKVEVSHHQQTAVIEYTPVFYHGRSFVPAHFSLETMMAGKMLACLERSFVHGRSGVRIKGRDFYDLLWFMQQHVQPLEEKLAKDGENVYTVKSAFYELAEKVVQIRRRDLAVDLLPLFESRSFIESWLDHFQENFERYLEGYLER